MFFAVVADDAVLVVFVDLEDVDARVVLVLDSFYLVGHFSCDDCDECFVDGVVSDEQNALAWVLWDDQMQESSSSLVELHRGFSLFWLEQC